MQFSIATAYYLIPSIFRGFLALAVLPFTTLVLGPMDYGIYAFASTFVQLSIALAMGGINYLVQGSFSTASIEEKTALISTSFWFAISIALIFSIGTGIAGLLFYSPASVDELPPWVVYWLIPCLIPAGIPWAIGFLVAIASGRARTYAACMLLETVVSTAVLLASLFVFYLGTTSLFLGAMAGAVVTVPLGLRLVTPYLRLTIDRSWMHKIKKLLPSAFVSILTDRGYEVSEKSLLTTVSGVYQVGLYAHSQQYKNAVAMPMKAVSFSAWPLSLREAREKTKAFDQTHRIWNSVFLVIGCSGIAFAFLAEPLITFLTNGKFTEAYPLAVIWLIFILIQSTGKSAMAVVHLDTSLGQRYQHINTVSSISAVLLLFLLVPLWGIYGAAASAIFKMGITRLLLVRLAGTTGPVPSKDSLAFIGAALICLALFLNYSMVLPSPKNFIIGGILMLIYIWIGRHTAKEIFSLGLHFWGGIWTRSKK